MDVRFAPNSRNMLRKGFEWYTWYSTVLYIVRYSTIYCTVQYYILYSTVLYIVRYKLHYCIVLVIYLHPLEIQKSVLYNTVNSKQGGAERRGLTSSVVTAPTRHC